MIVILDGRRHQAKVSGHQVSVIKLERAVLSPIGWISRSRRVVNECLLAEVAQVVTGVIHVFKTDCVGSSRGTGLDCVERETFLGHVCLVSDSIATHLTVNGSTRLLETCLQAHIP